MGEFNLLEGPEKSLEPEDKEKPLLNIEVLEPLTLLSVDDEIPSTILRPSTLVGGDRMVAALVVSDDVTLSVVEGSDSLEVVEGLGVATEVEEEAGCASAGCDGVV